MEAWKLQTTKISVRFCLNSFLDIVSVYWTEKLDYHDKRGRIGIDNAPTMVLILVKWQGR
jgi:hypothetical protein